MILVNFDESSFLKNRKVLNEVEVDGQPVDNDETPSDDYTEDNDTQAPADAGTDQPDGSEGNEDDTPAEDYTDDNGGEDAGENPDGDPEGGDDTGYDDGADQGQAGGEDTPDEQADDARGLEQEIFADLTPSQVALKHQELKSNFLKVYDSTATIIDRVNSIPSDERFTASISYVNKQLSTFRDTLTDYINDVYSTKSYMENQVNYYKFLNVLHSIDQILNEINQELS